MVDPAAVENRSVRPVPRCSSQAAIGLGHDPVAEAEGPPGAQGAARSIVLIEGLIQSQRRRRAAEGKIRDADEESQVRGVDEDLRHAGIAAGRAPAQRIVRNETVLRRASETRLRAIAAGTRGRNAQHEENTS